MVDQPSLSALNGPKSPYLGLIGFAPVRAA